MTDPGVVEGTIRINEEPWNGNVYEVSTVISCQQNCRLHCFCSFLVIFFYRKRFFGPSEYYICLQFSCIFWRKLPWPPPSKIPIAVSPDVIMTEKSRPSSLVFSSLVTLKSWSFNSCWTSWKERHLLLDCDELTPRLDLMTSLKWTRKWPIPQIAQTPKVYSISTYKQWRSLKTSMLSR